MPRATRETINILHVIDKFSMDAKAMHGATRLLSYMLTLDNKNPYSMLICSLKSPDAASRRLEEEGAHIIYLNKHKYDPSAFFPLIRMVRHDKINLLHLHGYRSWSLGRLIKYFTGIPIIVHCHGPDPSYPRIQRAADLVLAEHTDLAIAVSQSAKEFLIRDARVSPQKITVLYNCVSLTDFTPPSDPEIKLGKKLIGVRPGTYIVGTVTRLYEEKGNKDFLVAASKILKKFDDVRFVIVGDGPLRAELMNLSSDLSIRPYVIFMGFQERVQDILGGFDIMVQASIREGMPLTLLEAMAMAKPIVATTAGGMADILDNRRNAFLVKPKNPDELAEKILFLLKHLDVRKRLGATAYQDSKRYGVDEYVKKLDTIYQTVLGI